MVEMQQHIVSNSTSVVSMRRQSQCPRPPNFGHSYCRCAGYEL